MNPKQFKTGDLVYFHAYPEEARPDHFFFCKGYILDSLVQNKQQKYKVVIVSVYISKKNTSIDILKGKSLLGRKIGKFQSELTIKFNIYMQAVYRDLKAWVDIEQKALKKILNKIN